MNISSCRNRIRSYPLTLSLISVVLAQQKATNTVNVKWDFHLCKHGPVDEWHSSFRGPKIRDSHWLGLSLLQQFSTTVLTVA